ncbi:hypothetical protein B9Z55_015950 [Caenorhabditis nigoni]|uniref:Uncharacterized protein n=1 Tax=Caenorhabditis nigoni TaxID=1611254 RepID=A0A2G5UCH2_9PELO|nr:hypothetical protein B9Z55_015950 [Caenorhabditis nigoni]
MDLEPGEVVDLEPEQLELLTEFLKKREEDSGKPIGLEELKDWETEVLDQFQKTMEHAKKITGWSEEEILNQADELILKAKEMLELEKEVSIFMKNWSRNFQYFPIFRLRPILERLRPICSSMSQKEVFEYF